MGLTVQLSQWQGQVSQVPALKPYPKLAGGTLYFIDKPDAAQSEIRIGLINVDALRYPK